MKKLTERRKYDLRKDAADYGYRVGFSEDDRFAWVIINDHGDALFMNAVESYDGWRLYHADFIGMMDKVRFGNN